MLIALRFLAAVLLLLLAAPAPALAQSPVLEGYFIAFADCAATRKKDGDNPGNVRLEPMRAYEILARNAVPGTHYRLRVPNAPQIEERWVPMGCGAYAPAASLVMAEEPRPAEPSSGTGSAPALAADTLENVLAVSWQPGFCRSAAGRGKPECASLRSGRYDATHFTLHGLWPDDLDDKAIFPCYCDRGGPRACDENLRADETIALNADLLAALSVVMPGVKSGLHLHAWTKHGACYEDDVTGPEAGADPNEYFAESLSLLSQLNASAVRQVFLSARGQKLSRAAIEAAFDRAFGNGAGERVTIVCDGASGAITELRINLKGAIDAKADLGALINAAPPRRVSSDARSCASGEVVRAR
ncbi:ribonuclease T2 family protein [Afifella pfennigii]|uniref:ribonuclease T2 family protein n=1 Tax=Afifella pfennigii TaxID=209897 RepID=UPI00047C7BA5|nr:ribonuclease T(2) [Afifella pfennigii]